MSSCAGKVSEEIVQGKFVQKLLHFGTTQLAFPLVGQFEEQGGIVQKKRGEVNMRLGWVGADGDTSFGRR